MKKINSILLSTITAGFLVGCGGGDSTTGSTNTNTNTNTNTPLIVDSFTNTLSSILNKVYNTFNNSDYYYNLPTCRLGGLYDTSIKIQDSSIVETTFTMSNNTYSGVCLLDSAFKKLDLVNDTINASYVNENTFYDNTTKIYYDITPTLSVEGKELKSIVQITNDGLNGVLDDNTIIQISRAYKKSDLYNLGITKFEPIYNFQEGPSDYIMELGYSPNTNSTSKVYNFEGFNYNYSLTGCNLGTTNYNFTTYNDLRMTISNSYTSLTTCTISDVYQKLDLINETITASYINENTFYDNTTKIYYDITPALSYSGRELRSIVQITNDGLNGVLDNGSIIQILEAYKKI
ncbi:MAG: Unknown protein [uncultured Sulfurovum sp.]|uniref:Lipoprotein n=1 Tax=uncultured Sulfurovum sp. TaxID=269237 RepID=A0A6S6TCV0_9BACT|nr:MAG: Unknown protein [uncultured Sulfurovum sp.]